MCEKFIYKLSIRLLLSVPSTLTPACPSVQLLNIAGILTLTVIDILNQAIPPLFEIGDDPIDHWRTFFVRLVPSVTVPSVTT